MTKTKDGRRDRGAVLPIVALALPVLILMTAFAVDLGRQRSSRRTMQARADVIALDMVRLADGRTTMEILSDPGTAVELQSAADRNEIDRSKIMEIIWGEYDPSLTPLPFQPHHQPGLPPSDITLVPDAVMIRTSETTDYFFQPGSGDVTRTAVATVDDTPVGAFSLGSSLARLNAGDAALLNPFLGSLLGDPSFSLGALDYQGLVPARVSLFDLLEASPDIGTVDELLTTPLTLGEAAELFLTALTNRGELTTAELTAFEQLTVLAANAGTPEFMLGDIVSVAPDDDRALQSDVNAFDLFLAGAQAANRDNFVDFGVAVPISTVSQPGVVVFGGGALAPQRAAASAPTSGAEMVAQSAPAQTPTPLSARIRLIEPPRIAIGPAEQDSFGNWVTQAHSANVRVDVTVPAIQLGLGLPLLDPQARVNLPISISAAGASGFLTGIDCASTPRALDVLTAPRPIGLQLHADERPPSNPPAPAPPDPHTSTHPLLAEVSAVVGAVPPLIPGARLPIAKVRTKLDVGDNGSGDTLTIPVGEMRSGFAHGVGLSNMLGPGQLEVEGLGVVPIDGGAVKNALIAALTPVLTQIDQALQPVLSLLGARVGESDVQALSAKCDRTGVKLVG